MSNGGNWKPQLDADSAVELPPALNGNASVKLYGMHAPSIGKAARWMSTLRKAGGKKREAKPANPPLRLPRLAEGYSEEPHRMSLLS